MAALPLQYPDLAVHLCDQTLTPIISSASVPDQGAGAGRQATSPTDNALSSRRRAAALNDLAATALRARDTASRLGLGLLSDSQQSSATGATSMIAAPQHVVVTYNTGAVLIESYMDPHDLCHQPTFGSPGQTTATRNGEAAGGDSQHRTANTNLYYDDDEEAVDPVGAPLLVGLVAAPNMQSLRDARRATARLERVGRAFQHELVADQRRNR